jgi:hypothetical protein
VPPGDHEPKISATQQLKPGTTPPRSRTSSLPSVIEGTGHHTAEVENVFAPQRNRRNVWPEDATILLLRIDDDDERSSRGEVLGDLLVYLTRSIAGRHHLDGDVRRAVQETPLVGRGHALATNDGHVGRPNRAHRQLATELCGDEYRNAVAADVCIEQCTG